jgi:large subunit ribosomal protein L22
MAQHNYAYQKSEENTVKAVGRNLDISPKQGTEICKYVRGRPLGQAKMLLQQAIDMKRAVPFTRFNNGLGHKPGMSAGRFHPKACQQILKIIKSAEANAKNKGYSITDMKVVHIAMQIGPNNSHYGRQRRSIFKNSHIEVVLQEVKGVGRKEKKADTVKASEKKTKPEAKPKSAPKKEHNHETHAEHVKKDN